MQAFESFWIPLSGVQFIRLRIWTITHYLLYQNSHWNLHFPPATPEVRWHVWSAQAALAPDVYRLGKPSNSEWAVQQMWLRVEMRAVAWNMGRIWQSKKLSDIGGVVCGGELVIRWGVSFDYSQAMINVGVFSWLGSPPIKPKKKKKVFLRRIFCRFACVLCGHGHHSACDFGQTHLAKHCSTIHLVKKKKTTQKNKHTHTHTHRTNWLQ